MKSLFPELTPQVPEPAGDAPLADRMRPRSLEEFVGQPGLVGAGSLLRHAIESDALRSIILWGPPGTGKTTLATIIARRTRDLFVSFSAVLSGIKEIKEVMREAERVRHAGGRRTVLFVDEIHRFNKAQQDAFLPYLERGDIVLIGATTENPSFELNSALLSRSKVYVLEMLSEEQILEILQRALDDRERGLGARGLHVGPGCLEEIARRSQGDARFALNTLEAAAAAGRIDSEVVRDALQRTSLYYDKAGEEHFNLISALHKSMRSSDPDASIHWLARMIEAGEDPMYVARRIVRFASEDIGNADPRALTVALAARDAFHFLGLPEGSLALAQAVLYMATAPKSDAAYRAYGEAVADIRAGRVGPVPVNLRNAPTPLMSGLGYGRGYQHAHDYDDAITDQDCLPPVLKGRVYYRPTESGYEKTLKERMERAAEIRRSRGGRRTKE
ncbi:MAG TPA: replication-associated recombination protein A [Candidatus Polarisedimenticolia bacterium]|nr:replication-associated recombination protein A [Candidatus Polarisedimenticolia bacterium]